jgi:signal transduction histidine kinase
MASASARRRSRAFFEEFCRAKEAAQINTQAIGLGLALVRQIARNLGLAISVSGKEGEGTAFEVVFPRERSR